MSNAEQRQRRNAKDKVLRRVDGLLRPYGFIRSKPTFFIRPHGFVIEFVHLHKYTFAARFRPHLGLRVLNEPHGAVTLNGPTSDAYQSSVSSAGRPYDFSFGESEESIDLCAAGLAEFVKSYAERWFASWRDQTLLLESPDSPLHVTARAALAQALAGASDPRLEAATRNLLNVT